MEKKSDEHFSFEDGYERLEKILNELNKGEHPLEESLRLYEEANHLIALCSSKLNKAEQKIEMLIKSREGTIESAPFNPESEGILRH